MEDTETEKCLLCKDCEETKATLRALVDDITEMQTSIKKVLSQIDEVELPGAGGAESGVYVGRKPNEATDGKHKRLTFHRPACEWAQKISLGNLRQFNDRVTAMDAGYKPCRQCDP